MKNARKRGRIFYMRGEKMAIDFMPDPRSVYFKSLSNHEGYEEILAQGINVLSNNPFDIKKNDTAERRLKLALDVLKSGIDSEKLTEQQYIQNLISGISDTKLQQAFSSQLNQIMGDPFDYMGLINLINSILLGSKNYLAILQLEQKRMNELDKIYKNLIDTTNKTEEEIYTEQEEIKNIYLERHSMNNSQYSSFFTNITPTIDYLLAQYITNIASKITKDKQAIALIESQIASQKGNNQSVGTYILNNIIEQTNQAIPLIVSKALDENAASLNELMKFIEVEEFHNIQINGETVDFGLKNKSTKNIKIDQKKEKIEEQIKTSGDTLAKLLLEIEPNLNRADKNNVLVNILNQRSYSQSDSTKDGRIIFDLIEELRAKMEALEKKEEELAQIKNKRTKAYRETANIINSSKTNISGLQRRISRFVHGKIKKIIEKETEVQAKILAAQKIKEILTPSIISISGPQFSEIIDNYLQTIGENFFSGPKNAKADTVTIHLSPNQSKAKLQNDPILSAINSGLEGSETLFYDAFQEGLPKAGEATSFKQGNTAWYSAVKAQRDRILQNIDLSNKNEIEKAQMLEQIAKQMKNSIVITETMKTFNQYNNDIGFLSGSLGPNVLQQITNFSELFEKAGVPISSQEQEWLITALVNCSSSAIGTANKEPLEKYLSAMAGFAVFDEGSAEIEMIVNTTQNIYIDYSPQIMHLYKLNGLYFPGSYILQRIYDNLQNCINDLVSETTNNDGAVIRATASEKLIGSHSQDEGTARWARVYEAAQSNSITSINVAFLSGLLNIVDQLFAAFSQ